MRPAFTTDILGFGEPEMDANTALNELDKGLRSIKVGDQCEAIVRFPSLFERYPFPILINSAFLKLADVFRTGSNFLRLWVLRVCQQSERHLDKILNVEEFIKKIFSVMHSNDPIARALSLRTLGSLSGLIPERKSVHHSIRVALDSNDRVEVSAAIYAASCFAQRSKTFGTTMCTKISTMVQMLTTPLDLKLRLIPIFQHMHHDAETASTVRKLCQELLLSYPSENFVITILQTLTRLAVSAISDLTEQVEFLLKHLQDFRPQVKLCVLQNLNLLGQKGGHLWDSSYMSTLITFLLGYYTDRRNMDREDVDNQIIYTSLDVVDSLTSSSAILNFVYAEESALWSLLENITQSTDLVVVLKGIQIGTNITVNMKTTDGFHSNGGTRLIGLLKTGTETMLSTLCSQDATIASKDQQQELKYLKKCLIHGTSTSNASQYFCEWFCQTLGELVQVEDLAGSKRNLICQALGHIGKFNLDNVRKVVPELISMLNGWDEERLRVENNTVTVLVAIILHAHLSYSLDTQVKYFLKKVISSSNLWISYRIARSCFRFGQPEIAGEALDGLATKVSSESFFFWLSSLHSIAQAETILSSDDIPLLQARLTRATNLYLQAVASLKAASSPTASLEFQTEFVRLRCEMLVCFRGFLISCGNLQFSPPPAIAPSVSSGASKDSLMASGRVVSQLRKSVRELYALGEAYGRLYQTAFDSDNESLFKVRILQQVCQLVGRVVEKLVVPKEHVSSGAGDQAFSFCFESEMTQCYSWPLIVSCKRVVGLSATLHELSFEKGITQQHIDCLKEAFRILIETPVTYPRFFFQTLQSTRVKIAVSPQPRGPGEPITVVMGNHLALKVEGVIEQSFPGIKPQQDEIALSISQPNCFRKPRAIRITVISSSVQPVRTHSHAMELNKPGNTEPLVVFKDAVPHRDFFTVQFLLGLWTSGVKNLSIETSIIDNDELQWITGPKATLSIKVLDDVSGKGQSQPSSSGATSTAASRPATAQSTTVPSQSQSQIPGSSKSKPGTIH